MTFKDLPFIPAVWGEYGQEAAMKARTAYFESKQVHPDMPVGLCIGHLSDGRPEALVEAVDGAFDWLILALGQPVEIAKLYNWRSIKRYWDAKTGGKPLVVVAVYVKDRNSREVRELNEILEYSNINGCVYYEMQ